MAQQQSQSGQVGFKTQTAVGTYDSPGAVDPNQGVFPRVTSGSMVGNRELLIPDPEIGGNRDMSQAALGPIVYEGEYEMYCRFESIVTFLNAALGSTSTGILVDSSYTHTITPIDAGELPWLSVEERLGQTFESFEYTDARVNTLSLEAEAEGYLMANVGLAAITGLAGTTATVLTAAPGSTYVDAAPIIVGTEIVVDYGGVSLCAKSFNLNINNNFETDDFCLGQLTVDTFTPKRREVTAGITIRPEDSDLWRAAMFGSTVATGPLSGEAAQDTVDITITSNTNVGVGTTAYSLTVTIPVAVIQPFEVSPSGDDVIETDLEIQVLRPDPAVDLLSVAVVNALALVR